MTLHLDRQLPDAVASILRAAAEAYGASCVELQHARTRRYSRGWKRQEAAYDTHAPTDWALLPD